MRILVLFSLNEVNELNLILREENYFQKIENMLEFNTTSNIYYVCFLL